MTEQEWQDFLKDFEEVRESVKRFDELHDAFMKVPTGSPPETATLLESLRVVVSAYQKGSWLFRAIVWLVGFIVAAGAALQTLKFTGGG